MVHTDSVALSSMQNAYNWRVERLPPVNQTSPQHNSFEKFVIWEEQMEGILPLLYVERSLAKLQLFECELKFSETYMLFTITYIAIGLALTTIAIEIAADTLKKLHYFGRKIENVANVHIWFGGKKLTMKQLIRNLGDQFNLPVSTIKNLNLDHFVDQAIKVEAGEIPSLRVSS
ncbi:unnamed protein product [Toxocara canis]|uniref:Odorant receptor n=1 Tax=Toxocara canis TaxID=6265 RepID=A0A183U2P5_TOXCA|nr:unnamed protein product [Toxocara canis]